MFNTKTRPARSTATMSIFTAATIPAGSKLLPYIAASAFQVKVSNITALKNLANVFERIGLWMEWKQTKHHICTNTLCGGRFVLNIPKGGVTVSDCFYCGNFDISWLS